MPHHCCTLRTSCSSAQPNRAPSGSEDCCITVATANPARRMATSRLAVAAIWAIAPSTTATAKRTLGCGAACGVSAATTPKIASENGRPNRNRTSVAPHGPASPTSPRWSALRATCNGAAEAVRMIQSNFAPFPPFMGRDRPRSGQGGEVWIRSERSDVWPDFPTRLASLATLPMKGRETALRKSEPAGDPAAGRALFLPREEVVERVDIGLGRGGEGVGVRRRAGGDPAVFLEPHRHLGLGVGAFGDRVHLEEAQDRRVRHDRLDGVEHRVHRAVALGVGRLLLAVD